MLRRLLLAVFFISYAWAQSEQQGSSGSGITSVFGRTGAVTASTGDYSFSQISGSASAEQMPTDMVSITTLNNSTLDAALASLTATSAITLGGPLNAGGNVYANNGSNTSGCIHVSDTNGAHDMGICAPATATKSTLWMLPPADGSSGQALTTNAAGQLGWSTIPVTNALDLSPSGAQTLYNAGASGNTQINIKDSSSQAANTAPSIALQNNAAALCSVLGTPATTGVAFGDCTNYKQVFNGTALTLSSDATVKFKTTNNAASGTADVGLARAAVGGTIDVTNGSACCAAIAASQLVPAGTAPSIACGTGAGTTPPTGSACAISGADMSGTITITPTTGPAASATLATITFGVKKATYPNVCQIQWDGPAQAIAVSPYIAATNQPSQLANGTWVITTAGTAALTAGTTYKWTYICL
jgi:hypothetical protein